MSRRRTPRRSIGVTVQPLGVREPDDFNGAFAAMDSSPPDAILMVADSLTVLNRKRVFDYARRASSAGDVRARLYGSRRRLDVVRPDVKESFQRAADLAARIFQGAKPADLPFEEPTRYPFVVNLKTAKAIGIRPCRPNVVALADEVIE